MCLGRNTGIWIAATLGALVVGGCGHEQHVATPPTTNPPPPPATSQAHATSSPGPPPVAATTLAELVKHPCTALDQRDADALGVDNVSERVDEKKGTKGCSWLAVAGLLMLDSDPSWAQPRAAGIPNNTKLDVGGQTFIKINIGGYPALQSSLGTTCIVSVTTGQTQAFTFSAGALRGEKGEDMCDATRRFAAAVFAHQGPR